jgi:hypothetical protein
MLLLSSSLVCGKNTSRFCEDSVLLFRCQLLTASELMSTGRTAPYTLPRYTAKGDETSSSDPARAGLRGAPAPVVTGRERGRSPRGRHVRVETRRGTALEASGGLRARRRSPTIICSRQRGDKPRRKSRYGIPRPSLSCVASPRLGWLPRRRPKILLEVSESNRAGELADGSWVEVSESMDG